MTPNTKSTLKYFWEQTLQPMLVSAVFLFLLGIAMSAATTATRETQKPFLILFTGLVKENWVPATMVLSLFLSALLGGFSFFAVSVDGDEGWCRKRLYELTDKFAEFSFGITALACGLIFAAIVQTVFLKIEDVKPASSIGDFWAFVLLPLYCAYFRIAPKHCKGMKTFARTMGTVCLLIAVGTFLTSSNAAKKAAAPAGNCGERNCDCQKTSLVGHTEH